MMEKKIVMQYPWGLIDSTYYKNILEYPPKGIRYSNNESKYPTKKEVIGSNKKFESTRRLKNVLRIILSIVKIPNLIFSFEKGNLIHCAHCLSINKKPWVVDTEVWDRVAATGNIANSLIGKWIIKNRFESKYCRKIIAWSEDCKKTFEEAFQNNKKILSKLAIVPFAMPIPEYKKIKNEGIRLLFVARWFDAKGGRQTLEVFDRLTKKYLNVTCTFICPTPKEYKEMYGKNNRIKIMDLLPQETIFNDIYPAHDIFVYPGFGDSYGFAIPEVQMFGLPIVTVDSFVRKELVQDKVTGFIIPRPKSYIDYSCMDKNMLKELVDKTSLLIEDKKLRNKMSKNAKVFARKKFSIESRNRALRKIYDEAINK